MAKVICMASPKGGSGKTVLTATFAEFLHALGKKVLMVDTDASTNGLTLMYLKEAMLQSELTLADNRTPLGTYEITKEGETAQITFLPNGVHLIPATYGFSNTEKKILHDFEAALKAIIKHNSDTYDYIFLDAQAGSDNFAYIAMRKDISHEVVIVSEFDPLSAAGIERLKALFREDLTYNRTWVLLNKMLPDFVQSFSEFLEVAKYLSPIPWDADVVRAYARRKLAIDLENGNEFTLAIMQTIKSLFGDELKKEIEVWAEEKAEILRTPIERQYQQTIIELEKLTNKPDTHPIKILLKSYSRIRLIVFLFVFIILVLGITYFVKDLLHAQIKFSEFLKNILFAGSTSFFIYLILELLNKNITLLSKNNYKESEANRLNEKIRRLDDLRHADMELLIKSKKKVIEE